MASLNVYRVRRLLTRGILFLAMAAIAVTTMYPVFFTLNAGFKTERAWVQNRVSLAIPPTLDMYKEAWERSHVPRALMNSAITTAGGVVGSWIVCCLAAYAATKMRFRGRDTIFIILLASMMVPMQTILYPFYVLMHDLRLVDKHIGLIATFVTFAVPMTTYQLAAFFKGIPDELIEAARIDGASPLQILLRIIVPIAKPAIAVIGIINCVWMWNDLLMPLIVMQNPARQTLIITLANLRGQYGAETTLIAAGVIIGIAPIAVVYLLGQEYIVKGMTQGALTAQ
jgi:ABC-type glycerol-3-phosphate transport system permease component